MIVKRIFTQSRYRRGGSAHLKHSIYRYGGSSIFSNLIGKRFFQDNVKHLINSVSKSKLAQKATNAALDGATNAIKTQTQKGIEELTSNVIANIGKKKKNKKQKKRSKEQQDILNSVTQGLTTADIPTTSSIEGIIGKGIVYD